LETMRARTRGMTSVAVPSATMLDDHAIVDQHQIRDDTVRAEGGPLQLVEEHRCRAKQRRGVSSPIPTRVMRLADSLPVPREPDRITPLGPGSLLLFER